MSSRRIAIRKDLLPALREVIALIDDVLRTRPWPLFEHPESLAVYLVEPQALQAWRDDLSAILHEAGRPGAPSREETQMGKREWEALRCAQSYLKPQVNTPFDVAAAVKVLRGGVMPLRLADALAVLVAWAEATTIDEVASALWTRGSGS